MAPVWPFARLVNAPGEGGGLSLSSLFFGGGICRVTAERYPSLPIRSGGRPRHQVFALDVAIFL
jgi:hypothetical protein